MAARVAVSIEFGGSLAEVRAFAVRALSDSGPMDASSVASTVERSIIPTTVGEPVGMFESVRSVFESGLPAHLKPLVVLLLVFSQGRPRGVAPFTEQLAYLLGKVRRGVQKELGELQKLGLVKFAEGALGRGGRREFRLNLARLPKRRPWAGTTKEPRIARLGAGDASIPLGLKASAQSPDAVTQPARKGDVQ